MINYFVKVSEEQKELIEAYVEENGLLEEVHVHDEESAYSEVTSYIEETLFAFNTDFIVSHAAIELDYEGQQALALLQEEFCESANPIIKAMLKDFDEFIESAVSVDGLGHFLARYDGEEHEVMDEEGNAFYLYQA